MEVNINMERKKKKRFLERVQIIKTDIDLLKEQINYLRELSTSVASPANMQETSKHMYKKEDACFTKTINEILTRHEQLDAEIQKLILEYLKVQKTIDSVEHSKGRKVLYYRYMNGHTVKETAVHFHVSIKTINRWENAALDELVLPDSES